MNRHRYRIPGICLVLSAALFTSLPSMGQCPESVDLLAADYYEKGKFTPLIACAAALEHRLERREDKIRFYKLVINTYIELNRLEEAEETIRTFIREVPGFEPRPEDGSRLFLSLFNKVRLVRNQVYSVSKAAESLEEAPATVIVITSEQIAQRGYQSLEEMLHDLPGFDISTGRGPAYSNIYQRGYRSNQTDHTLMLIDGVEMNDLSSHNAFISRQYPLSNIKQVEIIYGPISNIYGANAFSGVINVVTEDASEALAGTPVGVRSFVSAGSWNTYSAEVTTLIKTELLSASVTGRVFTSDEAGHGENTYWDFDPDDEARYGSLLTVTDAERRDTILATPGGDAYFTLSDGVLLPTDPAIEKAQSFDRQIVPSPAYSNASYNYALSGKMRLADFSAGFQTWKKKEGNIGWYGFYHAGTDRDNYWIVDNLSVYLKYEKNNLLSNGALDLALFTRYKTHRVGSDTRLVRFSPYLSGRKAPEDLLLEEAGVNKWDTVHFYRVSNQFRMEARANYKLRWKDFDQSRIMLGAEFRNSQIQGDYVLDVNNPGFTEVTDGLSNSGNFFYYRDVGLFGEVVARRGKFKWTAGGRGDFNEAGIDGGYGKVFNLRSSLVYTHSPQWLFKTYYATAFKDASPFNRYSQASGRLANPTLPPERIKNIEINTIYKPSDRAKVELIGYYSSVTDIIGSVTVDGGTQNRSIGDSEVFGIHAMAEVSADRWSLFGNYTFLDPVVNNDTIDGLRIGDMASHRFNLGGRVVLPYGFNLHLRTNVVGERRAGENTTASENPRGTVPGYQVWHGVLGYRSAALPGLRVQLIVNNIWDTAYDHPGVRTADGVTYAPRLPQNERNFHVKVTYAFTGRR